MSEPGDAVARLAAEALERGGKVALATVLGALVPLDKLRELAAAHGLTPKGGFRLDRAPAKVVAPLLVEAGPPVLDEACALLRPSPEAAPVEAKGDETIRSLQAMLQLRDQEKRELQAELDKGRSAAERWRAKDAAQERRLHELEEANARQLAEIRALHDQQAGRGLEPTSVDARDARIHDLERDLESLGLAEEDLRRRFAEQAARVRELEAESEELRAQIPAGRRKKRVEPPPPIQEQFRLPYFSAMFYKSLEGKDRRSIEKAIQAVLLFCTEGPAYRGLAAKQLEGHGLWSLRASLKLRVLFRMLDDRDIELLELVDREDQNTALRRWRV